MAQPPDGSAADDRAADDPAADDPAADDPTVTWYGTDPGADHGTTAPGGTEPATPEPATSNPLISWAPSGDDAGRPDASSDNRPGATHAALTPPDGRKAVPVAGYVVAGTASRVVAYFVDGLILLAINVVISRLADPSAFDIGQSSAPSTVSSTLVLFTRLIAIGIEFTYFVGFWTSRGRATLGMRMLRIAIIDAAADRPLRLVPASARWFLLSGAIGLVGLLPVATDYFGLVSLIWIVVLFFSVVADPLGQGIHDKAAGSFIVQRAGVASNALLVGCVVLIVLFIAVPVLSLIFLGGQIEQVLLDIGQSI